MPQRVVLAVMAGLVLGGCAKHKPLEPVLQTVRAGVVERIQPDVPERYSVSIQPFAQVDLAFKSGGIVQALLQVRGADGRTRNVQVGDHVARGVRLAQVRPTDYQYRLDQAEAQRAQAQAELLRVRAQLEQARAQLDEFSVEWRRARNLFASASMVKPEYDQAKGHFETGTASVESAEAAVKAAEDAVANTRAEAKEANLSLQDAALRAPFAGWITALNVDRGSLVSGETVGFSMLDTHLVKAVFAVPDTSLSLIRLGQKQPVKIDALSHAVAGVITSIGPEADPQTRVFNVEVTIDNSREEIRPGMLGSVTLIGSRDLRPRLVVPLSAVVRAPANPAGFAVFRLIERDGKWYASAQKIEIGETFGNSIEVTRGLTAGERIIALGGEQVRNGQQVNVVP